MTVSDAGVFNTPYEPKADLLRAMARAAVVAVDVSRAKETAEYQARLREEAVKIAHESARYILHLDLKAEGIEVLARTVGDVDVDEWNGAATAEFTVDGLTFVVWSNRVSSHHGLHLKRECAIPGCRFREIPVHTFICNLLELGRALEHEARHDPYEMPEDRACDYIAPPAEPPAPTPKQLHDLATDRYKNIVKWRRTLELTRGAEKERAIQRILMERGAYLDRPAGWSPATSANAAEKLVALDKDYGDFCRALTDVVIEEIAAREALVAARVLLGDRAADLPLEEDGRHA